eukprot:1045334-Karenia_brevis.AAC.1
MSVWRPKVRQGSVKAASGGRAGVGDPVLFQLSRRSVWKPKVRHAVHQSSFWRSGRCGRPRAFPA